MQQRTFLDELKYQFNHGGATIRLLIINVGIFILINIFLVIGRLLNNELGITSIVNDLFALNTTLNGFITHPWSLFTSIFAHYSLWHIVLNMVFLYFSGRIFEQLFSNKRLFSTYILGGLAGGILEIIAHLVFPALQGSNSVVVGASGSIMAIFFAISFYQPKMKVNLFGVFPVQIIYIALIFLLTDFINLGRADGTAHFAHLGGAILGMLSIQNLHGKSNIINRYEQFIAQLMGLFRKKSRVKMKVDNRTVRKESDEAYNARRKDEQQEINRILDKISKSGYESLTKHEKDFLFNQSKK